MKWVNAKVKACAGEVFQRGWLSGKLQMPPTVTSAPLACNQVLEGRGTGMRCDV